MPLSPSVTLIGISGKQYAGKDQVATLLLEALPGFRRHPIAREIKRVYAEAHGLTLEEIETHKAQHRPGLIALGNQHRAEDPDYWLQQVLQAPGCKIIPDVRLVREFELLRQHGAFLLRVEADRTVREQRGRLVSEDDATECELDPRTDWDSVLVNNGSLEDLREQVKAIFPR